MHLFGLLTATGCVFFCHAAASPDLASELSGSGTTSEGSLWVIWGHDSATTSNTLSAATASSLGDNCGTTSSTVTVTVTLTAAVASPTGSSEPTTTLTVVRTSTVEVTYTPETVYTAVPQHPATAISTSALNATSAYPTASGACFAGWNGTGRIPFWNGSSLQFPSCTNGTVYGTAPTGLGTLAPSTNFTYHAPALTSTTMSSKGQFGLRRSLVSFFTSVASLMLFML